MEPILNVENLQKYYGARGSVTRAIDDFSFRVNEGEFVGIMGASGSGKTTLLNCIATIDRPTAGHIRIEGKDVTGLKGKDLSRFRRERLGFVFQDCNLLDTLTAFENIALALTILKTPAGEIEGRVQETARLLDITPCLNKFPYQLSGGQAQRVAIARALCMNPEILCFDEPTSALDPLLTKEVLAVMKELAAERMTMVVVTHEMDFARDVADRVVFMENGIVVEDNPPETLFASQNPRTRRFLGLE